MDSETNNYGSSKYRRQQLSKGIDGLKTSIPLSQDDSNKLSQLQTLHYACIYMRKQSLISELQLNNVNNMQSDDLIKYIAGSQFGISDTIHGFIIALSRSGHLIYVSDNVINYLGHSSMDVLLSADKFTDILHPLDESTIKSVLDSHPSEKSNHYEFYTSWYVSKIKRRVYTRSDTKVKISGRFIANNNLFVALCTPMLRVADKDYMDYLVAASPTCFTTIHGLDLRIQEICDKGQTILGYNESELQGVNLYDMTNFRNLKDLRKNHKSLLSNKSQRGKLEMVQLLMKNGTYLNCLVNMHYGNGNYIVCRFQKFSATEMADYENYHNIIHSFSASNALADDLDVSDQAQMSPSGRSSSDDSDQFINSRGKHRLDDDYYLNEDESSSDGEDSQECFSRASPKKKRTSSSTAAVAVSQPSYTVIKTEPSFQNTNYLMQQQPSPVQQQQFFAQYNIQSTGVSTPIVQYQPQYNTYQAPISPIPITEEMIHNLAAAEFAQNKINYNSSEFDAEDLPNLDLDVLNEVLFNESNFVNANDDSNSNTSSCGIPYEQQQQQQQQYYHYQNQQQQQQTLNKVEILENNANFQVTDLDLDQLLMFAEEFERCH